MLFKCIHLFKRILFLLCKCNTTFLYNLSVFYLAKFLSFLLRFFLRKVFIFSISCIITILFTSYFLQCKEALPLYIVLSLLSCALCVDDLTSIFAVVRHNATILKSFIDLYRTNPIGYKDTPLFEKLNEGFNTFIKNFPDKTSDYKFQMGDTINNLEKLIEMEKYDRYWRLGCYFGGFCVVVGVLSGLGYLGYLYWVVPVASSSPETVGQLAQNTAEIVTSSPELVTSVVKDIVPVVGQLATDSATTAGPSANVAFDVVRFVSRQSGAVQIVAKNRLSDLQQLGVVVAGTAAFIAKEVLADPIFYSLPHPNPTVPYIHAFYAPKDLNPISIIVSVLSSPETTYEVAHQYVDPFVPEMIRVFSANDYDHMYTFLESYGDLVRVMMERFEFFPNELTVVLQGFSNMIENDSGIIQFVDFCHKEGIESVDGILMALLDYFTIPK